MMRRLAGVFAVLTLSATGFTQPHASPARSGLAPARSGPASATTRAKLEPAPGSKTDAVTGLPTRVVHKASGVVLVLIPAGEFEMGSPDSDPDRGKTETRHRRVIRKPFYLGETEVTVGQFRRFVEATGYKTDAERGTPERVCSTTRGPRLHRFPTRGSWAVHESPPLPRVGPDRTHGPT